MSDSIRNEVKVGNIVGYSIAFYENISFIITSFYDTGVKLKKVGASKTDKELSCHNLTIKPIQITPKRLKQLMFSSIGNQFVLNGCWVTPLGNNKYHVKIGPREQIISEVHKLQNMFFRETGLELKVLT